MWYHSSPNQCCFIIVLLLTGNKFLRSSLQENKYNNNDIETVPHATLQHIEPTICHETLQLAHIKSAQECTYNIDKCWPHVSDYL